MRREGGGAGGIWRANDPLGRSDHEWLETERRADALLQAASLQPSPSFSRADAPGRTKIAKGGEGERTEECRSPRSFGRQPSNEDWDQTEQWIDGLLGSLDSEKLTCGRREERLTNILEMQHATSDYLTVLSRGGEHARANLEFSGPAAASEPARLDLLQTWKLQEEVCCLPAGTEQLAIADSAVRVAAAEGAPEPAGALLPPCGQEEVLLQAEQKLGEAQAKMEGGSSSRWSIDDSASTPATVKSSSAIASLLSQEPPSPLSVCSIAVIEHVASHASGLPVCQQNLAAIERQEERNRDEPGDASRGRGHVELRKILSRSRSMLFSGPQPQNRGHAVVQEQPNGSPEELVSRPAQAVYDGTEFSVLMQNFLRAPHHQSVAHEPPRQDQRESFPP